MIGDFTFLRKIQKYASQKLCSRIAERLSGKVSIYCKGIKTFSAQKRVWDNYTKYVFLRRHPSGTFEFRFFDTCESKIENVEKFFNYFFTELEKVKPMKEKNINFKEDKPKKIDIDYQIEKPNKKIKLNFNLMKNENKKINLCA